MTRDKPTGPSLPNFFAAIFNLRASIRYCLETLGSINLTTTEINLTTTELKNGAEIQSNETFANHLARLGKTHAVENMEFSYSIRFISETLNPQTDQNSPAKDIAVCTVAWGNDYRKVVQSCLDSQQFYCRKHGYDYARLTLQPSKVHRHASWYKIPLAYKLVQLGYKKVFYIDADALITNREITLHPFFEKLAEEKKAIHLAEDDDGVNMGVFFIDNSSDAMRLLDLLWIYDLGAHRLNWEQAAFKDLLDKYAQVRKLLSVAQSARAFNSFPRERESICRTIQKNNWTRGDFICHFSGIPSPDLEKLISRYVAEYDIELSW